MGGSEGRESWARFDLVPSSHFVFRTPLLPLSELVALGADTGDASDETCARVREQLARALARAEVREALFLASPGLEDSIPYWQRDPDSARGQKIERALVRYFARMASRATPFGLFAGIAVGRTGARTALELAGRDRYGRSTRLDNDYLFALATALRRDPAIRQALLWKPNSSLYTHAGRHRYAEARLAGKRCSYHLIAARDDPYLRATLERAQPGARLDALARALVADDPEIDLEEAKVFVDELVDAQMLVCDLAPAVTGPNPIAGILALLERAAPSSPAAARLGVAASAIEAVDRGGLGQDPGVYQQIASSLEALPAEVELSRMFQVDLVKPAPQATLGSQVLAEIMRGIEVLRRCTPAATEGPLSEFRRAFSARYGDSEMPLLEVLDEESGIGFGGRLDPGAAAVPLLAGLQLPPIGEDDRARWGKPQRFLLRKLQDVWARGERELVLDDADLDALSVDPPAQQADALSAMAAVAARSSEDLASGDFQVLLEHASGPSGARLLGRFCHASPEVAALVDAHLRAEEALRPGAIFAEIVHLNEGRVGNILCRPVLRQYEIPFLGISGAPEDRQIPVQDLMVSVQQERVHLRSLRLDREVIPRLSAAHNVRRRTVGVYRFLATLQSQDGGGYAWQWGPLASARFLPRVRHGRLVLARACWLLDEADLAPVARAVRAAHGAKQSQDIRAGRARVFAAVQALRASLDLPRYIVLADADSELSVDLDNPLAVTSLAWGLHRRSQATVLELFPGPDELVARGPEGRFVHELVVSFTRKRAPAPAPPPRPARPCSRRFAPGSEWLFAKLYAGSSTADEVLRRVVAPVRARALASGAATHWFFLRYSDPDHHIRVRFCGAPERLHADVLPALQQAAEPMLADGSIWRVQLDTYEREVERYGGPEGIEPCERLFWCDSEAVLDIVQLLEGDAGADARWRLALRGADMLLDDLGLDLEQRIELAGHARDSFRAEHGAGPALFKQIGARFRRERDALFAMLARDPDQDRGSVLEPGFAALAARSIRLRLIVAELGARDRAGRLAPPIRGFAWSLVHMHVNRLLHASQRAQELVLYDLLHRWYVSQRARRGAPPGHIRGR